MSARIGNLSAPTLYLILRGVVALLFTTIFTVTAVYRVQVAGLNPLELVLVGTVLELSVLLFEIPTGVVADVYSRRLSVVIGYVLIGLGFLVEGALPLLGMILVGQVLWGVGYTFTSGAEAAWLADEVGAEVAAPLYVRGAQMGHLGALAGAALGGGLAIVAVNLPILLGGALFVALGLALALTMPERGLQPTPASERASWRAMGDTALAGARLVRASPLLLTLLGSIAFAGMSSEGFDRLWAAHFLEAIPFPTGGELPPVAWFGVFSAGSLLLALAATELVRRWLDLTDQTAVARVLLVATALLATSVLVFALANAFWLALAAYWATIVLRRVIDPVLTAWLNQHLDARVRATALSIASQADALGQVAGGPVLGAIGTVASLRAALVAAAVALLPALALYARAPRLVAAATDTDEEVARP